MKTVHVQCAGDCITSDCNKFYHRFRISDVDQNLNKIILKCGEIEFGHKILPSKQIPGLKSYVSEMYDACREGFLEWKRCGSRRKGRQTIQMRISPVRFKLSLRWCEASNTYLRKKLAAGDTKSFWKRVRSVNLETKLPHAIDGTAGDSSIAHLWRQVFRDRFKCVSGSRVRATNFDTL